MILYGIKNCGTVKKAVAWLNSHSLPFEFHDYKKQGIAPATLGDWSRQVGTDSLINRKGTTWRKLDDSQKEQVKDEKMAIEIMAANTSLIKRPIIENEGEIAAIGFDEDEFSNKFLK